MKKEEQLRALLKELYSKIDDIDQIIVYMTERGDPAPKIYVREQLCYELKAVVRALEKELDE